MLNVPHSNATKARELKWRLWLNPNEFKPTPNEKDGMTYDCAHCWDEEAFYPIWYRGEKWCPCCFQNIHNKSFNTKTKRWVKNRCACHNVIETYDEATNEWVCPFSGRRNPQ
jgi:hypothetical protein